MIVRIGGRRVDVARSDCGRRPCFQLVDFVLLSGAREIAATRAPTRPGADTRRTLGMPEDAASGNPCA